jgi:hypothetical protein
MSILRDITVQSKKYWGTDEILIFIGARQSGKTTILKQIQSDLQKEGAQCFFLDLEDPDYLKLLNEHPKNLFRIFPIESDSAEKKNVVFVDEVQYLKDPSNFLKYIFDEHKENIKLIVSGSSAFYIDNKFKDSLAGRKHLFFVPTLSFKEFLRFKGKEVLSGKNFSALSLSEKSEIEIFYREFITYGGYPRAVLAPMAEKTEILREIAYSFIKKDIYESGIKQEESFYGLLRILAEQTGNLVNSSELANTLNVSKTAIDNYLFVMQKSFLIHLAKPFFRNVRKEITKMPKVFFLDLGLRNFFTKNFSPFDSRHDKGSLLENAVFRQLLDEYHKDDINFWRTSDQKEIDFVVGEKIALEVKADIRTFKDKNLQAFLGVYPDIKFSLVTLNGDTENISKYPVKNVWEI